MPFLDLDHGRLFYLAGGRGLPLVLLHGAWASHGWWRWQIPELSRLYRVIAPDLRGHGLSSDFETSCSVEGFAEDLAHLLSACGLRRTALIGWSMGGMVAMRYALAHPARVAALVLMGTRAHRNPAMKPRILLGLLPLAADPLSGPRRAARIPETDSRTARGHAALGGGGGAENAFPRCPAGSARMGPVRDPAQPAPELPADRPLPLGLGGRGRAAGTPPPTLILAGENDPWAPPRFSELLHDLIPDSRLLIVPGAGHYLALEHASLVNARILGFLDQVGYR